MMGVDPKIEPLVVGLQPIALVCHTALIDFSLLHSIPGELCGSQRVNAEELQHILAKVNMHMSPSSSLVTFHTLAGGSVANTIRGLARGFGVPCALVGACGDDEQGHMFAENMKISGVDVSRLRVKKGPTGQCACLVDAEGNRTMRPYLPDTVRFQVSELQMDDFKGAKLVVLNGYGFYGVDLVERAAELAKKEGALVSIDLASFEVVRIFLPRLTRLLESGKIDLCFANEDEAHELMREELQNTPESCLDFLAKYCTWAVVMLGSKVIRVAAISEAAVVDTTDAGDLFASGFLYAVLNGFSLKDCCTVGCCAGAAVVKALGEEVTPDNWFWMHRQLKSRGISREDSLAVSSKYFS